MNIDPQGKHDIKLFAPETEEERAQFLRLTDDQAAALDVMTPKERHDWLRANLSTKERLSRHLRWLGLPVLASRAATGEFSDFEGPHAVPKIVLVRELRDAERKAARRKNDEHCDKVFRIKDLVKLVIDGEYDDTREESDAWAARQTGEVRELLDRMERPGE